MIGGWASVRMSLGRRLGWELQLFAPLGRFQPQKNLQLSLIPLNFVRPVTPKVAGSSPVAPGTWMAPANSRERRHRGLARSLRNRASACLSSCFEGRQIRLGLLVRFFSGPTCLGRSRLLFRCRRPEIAP
jgi:hypothetical protein